MKNHNKERQPRGEAAAGVGVIEHLDEQYWQKSEEDDLFLFHQSSSPANYNWGNAWV